MVSNQRKPFTVKKYSPQYILQLSCLQDFARSSNFWRKVALKLSRFHCTRESVSVRQLLSTFAPRGRTSPPRLHVTRPESPARLAPPHSSALRSSELDATARLVSLTSSCRTPSPPRCPRPILVTAHLPHSRVSTPTEPQQRASLPLLLKHGLAPFCPLPHPFLAGSHHNRRKPPQRHSHRPSEQLNL